MYPSNHNGMKLKINIRWKTEDMWKLNNILLNNQWVKEEIAREIRKYIETDENKTQCAETYEKQ